MISCNLQGGLGNQMFQIAATYALALRNNDTCGFEFEKCYTPLQGYKSTKYQDSFFSKINSIKNFLPSKIYSEPKFSFSEIPYNENILLNGYFQSEKYFKDFKNEIVNLFSISEEKVEQVIKFISLVNPNHLPTTIVHVRRGDYLLNSEFHHPQSLDYFKKGFDILGECCYIFVSDDMNFVKTNFKNTNFFYFESNDEILDLTLMTQAQNVIISNSSFSWWGAYLNQNQNKKVIAPKKWFGIKGPKDIDTLLPKEWITI